MGVSERDGRTLANVARCLLEDGGFQDTLWAEIFFTARYNLNRAPHSGLDGSTPFKLLFNNEATLSHMRAIGGRAFFHIETYTKKLDEKAWEGRLCGYSMDSKAHRIYNPKTKRAVESRSVHFIETPAHSVSLPGQDGNYDDDDDYVRDVRCYTSGLDLMDFGETRQHTIAELKTLLDRIKELIRIDCVQVGGDTPRGSAAPSASHSGGVLTDGSATGTTDAGGAPSPEGAGGAPSPGGKDYSAPVTRGTSQQETAPSEAPELNTKQLRAIRKLNMAIPAVQVPDYAHGDEFLSMKEYIYATSSPLKESSSERELVIIPNNCAADDT